MFTFKYKITDADMKAVNKRLMWSYFIPYLAVSLVGLGAGIAATILRPRTEIMVFGILLIVLSAILFGCSMLLLLAPKNFVASALLTSVDTERTVTIGDGIVIATEEQKDIELSLSEFIRFKNHKTYILAYLDKNRVLLIKDAEQNGKTLAEVFEHLKNRTVSAKPAQKAVGEKSESAVVKADDIKENDADGVEAQSSDDSEAEKE